MSEAIAERTAIASARKELRTRESFFGIVPQTQPTNCTCTQTCLAMALNVPVQEVIDRYGGDPMNQQSLCAALSECKFLWNQMTNGTLVFRGWCFAVVPSLNHKGGSHQVLMHWDCETGLFVLDPAIGERYARNGNNLTSWSYLTPFWLGGVLP